MKVFKAISFPIIMLLSIAITATAQKKLSIKTESLSYTIGDEKFLSYVAYSDKTSEKRPVVLVVHEWWGMNDYVKRRACQLVDCDDGPYVRDHDRGGGPRVEVWSTSVDHRVQRPFQRRAAAFQSADHSLCVLDVHVSQGDHRHRRNVQEGTG